MFFLFFFSFFFFFFNDTATTEIYTLSLHDALPICDARLAHDAAFFFDFAPYAVAGSGVLHAYRHDAEATGQSPVERDNRDISMTLGSLDEWLWTIARHAESRPIASTS